MNLEQLCDALQDENAALRQEVAALKAWREAVPVAALRHYWLNSDWFPGAVSRDDEATTDSVLSEWLDVVDSTAVQG